MFPLSMKESSGTLGAREIIKRVVPYSKRFNEVPKKITDDTLAILIDEGLASTASPDPHVATRQAREAGKRVVILPLEHRIPREKGDRIVKDVNPKNYLYLDSAPVIRDALRLSKDFAKLAKKRWGLPDGLSIDKVTRLTDQISEMSGMYPYFQIKAAVKNREGKPPLGFYWVARDGRPRVVTWMRSIKGNELFADYNAKRFSVELDKKFYGDTIKVTVQSQSKPRKEYDIWLTYLPIFSSNDREQHSYWRKLESSDRSPDAGYRGKAHKKRGVKSVLFTAYAICGYGAAAVRLRNNHESGFGREIQVNPFPIPTDNGKDLVRILREQTIIGKRGLNMTEMDRLIGADTMNVGYDTNFANWTK